MDRFLLDAENILKAGVGFARCGEDPSSMVVLVGVQGHIQMLADCDWPLASLRRERGADSAYRVSSQAGSIVVEGEERGRKCRIEQRVSMPIAARPSQTQIPAATSALVPVWR